MTAHGVRLQVVSEQADYVAGLLSDEGLQPRRDWFPTGGCEFVVTPEAWAGLPEEARAEIARHLFPPQPRGHLSN